MAGKRPTKFTGVLTALVIATAKAGIDEAYFVSDERFTTVITFLAKAVVGATFFVARFAFLVPLFLEFFLVLRGAMMYISQRDKKS